jgi:hypothetical protein
MGLVLIGGTGGAFRHSKATRLHARLADLSTFTLI